MDTHSRLATATRIVEVAGRPNGGVMLDTWHLYRSGGSIADVAGSPAERIVGLQLNDAPASEWNARVRQDVQHRLLPGQGVIPLAELLTVLQTGGCTAPIGLEVNSAELALLPAAEVVTLLAAAMREITQRDLTAPARPHRDRAP